MKFLIIVSKYGCDFLFNDASSIVGAPWYVTNDMIHKDLGITAVHEVIHNRNTKHRTKLESHSSHYSKTSHETTSHKDWKDGSQLTCNTMNEISSLEGTSSRP